MIFRDNKPLLTAMSVPVEARFGHGLGVSLRPVPVDARFGHGRGFSPGSVPVEPCFGHGLGVSLRSVPVEPRFGHGRGVSPRPVPVEPRFGHGQKILSVFSVRSNLARSQQAILALSPCKLKHRKEMFAKTKK